MDRYIDPETNQAYWFDDRTNKWYREITDVPFQEWFEECESPIPYQG